MLLSLTRTLLYFNIWPTIGALLACVALLVPLVGAGFLIVWGVRSLATGLIVKGLFILLVTGTSVFFFYRWLYEFVFAIMVGKMGSG
jgi:hypothetical protein